MRAKAGNVGNIVGKNIPVSQTEVRIFADLLDEKYTYSGEGR
jgi:hypothetical protein